MENRKKKEKSMVREFRHKIRRSRFRRRIACMFMAVAVLLAQIEAEPLAALAASEPVFQSGGNVWAQSDTIAVAKPGLASSCFDIYGVADGRFYQSTFKNGGYQIASEVNGTKVGWSAAPRTDVPMGSSLVGRYDYEIVYDGRYVKITYTVKNTGSKTQSFKVGSSGDVTVGENDRIPIVRDDAWLEMKSKNIFHSSEQLKLFAPGADEWCGHYADAYKNIFNSVAEGTKYNGDGGMAWSWSGNVAPGETWTRSAYIGIGELPEGPWTLLHKLFSAVQLYRGFFLPGEEVTVGAGLDPASPGGRDYLLESTGHILFEGTEYEAEVFEDFITPTNMILRCSQSFKIPLDAEDGSTYYAYIWVVGQDGGWDGRVWTVELPVQREPQITLTDSTVSVLEGETLDDAWYRKFIKSSVGEVSYAPLVDTGRTGTYTVTYTASRAYFSDKPKAALKVTVLPRPLDIAAPTAVKNNSANTFNLSATLNYPGGDCPKTIN